MQGIVIPYLMDNTLVLITYPQGFRWILFMSDEAAEIISHCEERLLQNKTITEPFSAAQIQGGILKEHLIEEDYLAPQKVIIISIFYSQNNFCYFVLFCWWVAKARQ